MPTHPEHTPAVLKGLARIDKQSSDVMQLAHSIMQADGGNMFEMDLLTHGAVKRHVSTAAAFAQLIQACNMVTARALLRIHIDTALRYSAAWLTDSPNVFAREVLGGKRIDRIKDSGGKPMTDRHLVEVHTKAFPQLPTVYTRLSGYIHFSDAHIVAPMTPKQDESFEVAIGPTDDGFPEESWLEIIECFLEVSQLLEGKLRDWLAWKVTRGSKTFPTSPQS